jgi:hypothetical protein
MKAIIVTTLLLICATMLFAQWHIDEGFEGISTLPAGWSIVDDGDGNTWRNLQHANAHSGSRVAFVDNYLPNQNADWLITPQISVNVGDNLEFYTRAWYGSENLKVFVSTTTPSPGALSTQILNLQGLNNVYQQASVSLNQFAGLNIYIGFFWQCTTYGVLIDDVKVGQEIAIDPELNLPESISFFSSQSYFMNFSEYIVSSNIALASISAEANPNINVQIDGLDVSFSAPGFVGVEEIVFTLDDAYTGLIAMDTLQVVVLEDPAVDLFISRVTRPRPIEYQNLPMTVEFSIGNAGWTPYNDFVSVDLQVYDEMNVLLHSDTRSQMVDLQPGATASLSMPNSFTPLLEGVLRFVFNISSADSNPNNNTYEAICTVVYRHTTGGPDTFGYRFADSNDPLGPTFDWIEISATGTSSIMYGVPSFHGDDNFSEAIPLGFSFPFYGSSYSTAYIDTNGEILLAPNSWQRDYPSDGWENDGNMFNYMYPIPGYNQMPALIAVYWDDLHADEGTGDVYFQTFGSAPNRYTVVQWNDLRFHSGTNPQDLLKFQVILHENGYLKMQYHTVATGQTGATIPHDNGASATIAIQNQAANTGLLYLREIVQNNTYIGVEPAGNMLHDNLAILFYSGADEQAPIITHKAKGNTFFQQQELLATMIDMSMPIAATLHYNIGSGWQQTAPTSVSGNDYAFNIVNLPLGSTVQYYFAATDNAGNSALLPPNAPNEHYSFKVLPTADAQVLIAYSGTQDYNRIELPVYENLLTELNIHYDIYNWEEYDNYQIPSTYKGILAYANTGSAHDAMQYFASQLSSYLDSGTMANPRNLWFSSDGLASSQHAHPNSSNIRRMMSGYFRTYYVPTGFGGGTNGLAGPNSFTYEHGTILALPGTPVGTVNMEYPVYANTPDCIFPENAAGDPYYDTVPYPEIGAQYIYAFEDGPINGQAYLYHGVAATSVETPSFRTLYFSFDFSQLSNPAHRHQWMDDLMDWWGVSPSATDDSAAPASYSGINKVYPNPFNPNTSISYTLDKAAPVKIEIFNLRGQKVKELINEFMHTGSYTVAWDGTDKHHNTVASGVYYLRFVTPEHSQTRKITMIK